MSNTRDIWQSTAVANSGATSGNPTGAALEQRANILQMTQATEDAVLRPAAPGAWPDDLRAALASRIANLNKSEALAAHYSGMVGISAYADLADPSAGRSDSRLAGCLKFVDQVATQPKDVAAHDIEILQTAGIADADIVRLTELVAFMAFQVRLTAGLKLLAEME